MQLRESGHRDRNVILTINSSDKLIYSISITLPDFYNNLMILQAQNSNHQIVKLSILENNAHKPCNLHSSVSLLLAPSFMTIARCWRGINKLVVFLISNKYRVITWLNSPGCYRHLMPQLQSQSSELNNDVFIYFRKHL